MHHFDTLIHPAVQNPLVRPCLPVYAPVKFLNPVAVWLQLMRNRSDLLPAILRDRSSRVSVCETVVKVLHQFSAHEERPDKPEDNSKVRCRGGDEVECSLPEEGIGQHNGRSSSKAGQRQHNR